MDDVHLEWIGKSRERIRNAIKEAKDEERERCAKIAEDFMAEPDARMAQRAAAKQIARNIRGGR